MKMLWMQVLLRMDGDRNNRNFLGLVKAA